MLEGSRSQSRMTSLHWLPCILVAMPSSGAAFSGAGQATFWGLGDACVTEGVQSSHAAAFVQAGSSPQRSPGSFETSPVMEDSFSAQLRPVLPRSAFRANEGEKTGAPSLWGVMWLTVTGEAGSASRSVHVAVLFSAVAVLLVFAIVGLFRCTADHYGKEDRCWPKKLDPDWDAALEEHLAATGLVPSPSCDGNGEDCNGPFEGGKCVGDARIGLQEVAAGRDGTQAGTAQGVRQSGPELQTCRSDGQSQAAIFDPQLSPRAESFTSCEDLGVALPTPRSIASFADCEEVETLMPSQPPSRPHSRMGNDAHAAEMQRDFASCSYRSFPEH